MKLKFEVTSWNLDKIMRHNTLTQKYDIHIIKFEYS